jgi:hypothetical protein
VYNAGNGEYLVTGRRQLFVEEYLKCWNATEAARRAGYAHPEKQGWRILQDGKTKSLVAARVAETAMGANEVLYHLAEQARGDIGLLFRQDPDGVVDVDWARVVPGVTHSGETQKMLGHLVKSITFTKDGPRLEMYDAQSALVHIGRHLGLFVDKVAPTTPDGEREYGGAGGSDERRLAAFVALYERVGARVHGASGDGGILVDPASGAAE